MDTNPNHRVRDLSGTCTADATARPDTQASESAASANVHATRIGGTWNCARWMGRLHTDARWLDVGWN